MTDEQIDCCRRIGRNEQENHTTIRLSEFDALCEEAISRGREVKRLRKFLREMICVECVNAGNYRCVRNDGHCTTARLALRYDQSETKSNEPWGIAFTETGRSPEKDKIIGWMHREGVLQTWQSKDDALEACDLAGWTGYVCRYPSGAME